MWKAVAYLIIIYGKRKSYGGSKTRNKNFNISHPDIDFGMDREIDLKA